MVIFDYILRGTGLVLAGLLIYAQTFHFNFVFDDKFFIVNNPYIKDFSNVHLMWHSFPMTRLVGMYSFALNYYFDQLAPQGYHIFNFIIHLLSVGMVWALARLLLNINEGLGEKHQLSSEIPFIVAALFLVHPCQTQAVSYITQRFESMATLFYVSTVYCYLRARISTVRVRRIIFFGLAGFLSMLGIMTKEVFMTVPGLILAAEWILFPRKRNTRFCMVLLLGWVLAGVVLSQMLQVDLKAILQSIPSESHDGDVLTPGRYLLTQMRVFLTLMRLLVLPVHQNLDYDYPASTSFIDPPLTLVGLSLIVAIIFIIIKWHRSCPLIAFGLSWVLITFSINLVPRANVIFEHKLYLISFGFFLAAVVALSYWVGRRGPFLFIIGSIIVILAFLAFQRNKVWKDELSIWDNVIQNSPHKARPYLERGVIYFQQGAFAKAIINYDQAIAIDPHDAEAYDNRGVFYYYQSQFEKALADYNKAIAIDPQLAKTYYDRSFVDARLGQSRGAIADEGRAIELKPDYPEALYNRGLMYAQLHYFPQAMADFNKALGLDHDFEEVYANRGIIDAIQGDLVRARSDLDQAIRINPQDAGAFSSRGNVDLQQGRFIQALGDYQRASELNPGFIEVYNNLAIVHYHLGNYAMAWDDLHKAQKLGVRIDPQFIQDLKEGSGREK